MIIQLCLLMFSARVFAFDFKKIVLPTFTSSQMTLGVTNDIVGLYFKDAKQACYITNSDNINYLSTNFSCINNDLLDFQSPDLFIAEISYYNSDWLCVFLYGGFSFLKNFGDCFILSATEEYQFAAFVDTQVNTIICLRNGSYNIRAGNFNETNFSKSSLTMKPSGIIGSKIPSNKIMWIFLYDTNFTYCFESELYLCSQNSIRFSGEVISMTAKGDLLALYMNTGTNPAISLYNLTNLSFITQIIVNDSPNFTTISLSYMKFMNTTSSKFLVFSVPYSSSADSVLRVIQITYNNVNKSPSYITSSLLANQMQGYTYNTSSTTPCFGLDSQNKLFLRNFYSSENGANQLLATQLCARGTYYLSGDKCTHVDPGYFTLSFQDATQTACIDAIIKSSYNISMVNAFCPINCSLGFFGPRCEDCDAYMTRIGSPAPVYQKYVFDTANKTCVLMSDPEYCSKYKYCLECSNRNGCSFINNKCQMENSYNINSTIDYYFSKCPLSSISNPTYCGNSQLDIVTQDIKSLKPTILTPKDTICYYELTMPSQRNITLNFTLNQYESLSIYFCNGTCTQIQYKSNGRMLGMVERGLSSSTKYSFSSNGYSKLSVLYTNSEITVSSMSFDNPIGLSSNQSSGNYLYVAIFVPISCLCCCCICCLIIFICFKINKIRVSQRNIVQDQEFEQRVSNIELNRERIFEEDKSQYSIRKYDYTDKDFKSENLPECAFCLDPMNEKTQKIKTLHENHKFHFECFKQYERISAKYGKIKCVLCRLVVKL